MYENGKILSAYFFASIFHFVNIFLSLLLVPKLIKEIK